MLVTTSKTIDLFLIIIMIIQFKWNGSSKTPSPYRLFFFLYIFLFFHLNYFICIRDGTYFPYYFYQFKTFKKALIIVVDLYRDNFFPILLVFPVLYPVDLIRQDNLKIWYPVNYYNGQISESALISHHQCRLSLRRVQATHKVNFVRIEHVFFLG